MIPTSYRDFPCTLPLLFLFFNISSGLDTNRPIIGAPLLSYDPMNALTLTFRGSSSYAPAMSTYIYVMTHILFIASSSHPRFPTFARLLLLGACTTVNPHARSYEATPDQEG